MRRLALCLCTFAALGTAAPAKPADPVRAPKVHTVLDAARIAAAYGSVTSMYRTVAHNREVGGVPNSYHLQGRAIDVVRRPGVPHRQIDAALRSAGYVLLESLDEGDHSHFAFGSAASSLTAAHRSRGLPRVLVAAAEPKGGEVTDWGIVTISNRRGGGLSRR